MKLNELRKQKSKRHYFWQAVEHANIFYGLRLLQAYTREPLIDPNSQQREPSFLHYNQLVSALRPVNHKGLHQG